VSVNILQRLTLFRECKYFTYPSFYFVSVKLLLPLLHFVSVNILQILNLFRECKYFTYSQNMFGEFEHFNYLKLSLSKDLVLLNLA